MKAAKSALYEVQNPTYPLRHLVFLLVLTLAASGCFKVNMDLRIQENETVDGEMTIAVSEQLLALVDDSQDVDELFSESDLGEFANSTATSYSKEGFVGQTVTFSGENLSAFDDDTPNVSKTEDGWKVNLVNEELSGGSDNPIDENTFGNPTYSIRISAPGKILDHNGTETKGSQVIWEASGAELADGELPKTLQASWDNSGFVGGTPGAKPSGSNRIGLIILVGLIFVIGIAALIVLRRGRSKQKLNETAKTAATESEMVSEKSPVT